MHAESAALILTARSILPDCRNAFGERSAPRSLRGIYMLRSGAPAESGLCSARQRVLRLQSSAEEAQGRQGIRENRVEFLYKCTRAERITASQHPGRYGIFSHGTVTALLITGMVVRLVR